MCCSQRLLPDDGNSKARAFTLTCSDPRGYTNLKETRVLFNSSLNGRGACYLYYLPPNGPLALVTPPNC